MSACPVSARLYVIPLSNPAAAAAAMLAGLHPLLVRLAGFAWLDGPGLELDGTRRCLIS